MNCHCCVDLDHMAEVVSVRLLKLPPLLCCTLWKEVTVHSPHLSRELRSTSLRVLSLYKLFESVLHGIFFSSPLLACLIIYGSMAVYFILCITFQYYFILLLRLFQLWLLGVLSFGSCVPLTCPGVIFCLGLFLTASLLSGPTRCPRLILCVSCPSPGFSHFSKGAFY